MRRVFRMIVVPFLAGSLILGAAWAGAALTPAPKTDNVVGKIAKKDKKEPVVEELDVEVAEGTPVSELAPLPNGLVYAGASKVNLYPRPEDYDGVWEKDTDKCSTLSAELLQRCSRQRRAPCERGIAVAGESQLHLHGWLRHRSREPDLGVRREVRDLG